MFKLADKTRNEFTEIIRKHIQINAVINIFYENIRMIKGATRLMDRECYKENYLNILTDIKLVSNPVDTFLPDTDGRSAFSINRKTPEYIKIQSRINDKDIIETLTPTHELSMKLLENPNLISNVHDDLFINYCTFKYLNQIEWLRLQVYSNIHEIIEYVVENVTLEDIRRFMISKKINFEKYTKHEDDLMFIPEMKKICDFYNVEHDDIPAFDVEKLMLKLFTNVIVKSDKYIIIGIYQTLSFTMSDIHNNRTGEKCVNYVRDVISQIII